MGNAPDIGEDAAPFEEKFFTLGKHWTLLVHAAATLLRFPLRSAVVVMCLAVILSPFVTAIAINEGVKSEYAHSLRESGDVLVTADSYGSNAPVDLQVMKRIEAIQGVTRVVPRVIGRTYVEGKLIAVVGSGYDSVSPSVRVIRGRTPTAARELMLGFRAARHLGLDVGTRFSLTRRSGMVFEIVGLFDAPCTIWTSDLLFMGFEDASELFSMHDKATDLVVHTRPGYQHVVDALIRTSEQHAGESDVLLRVQTRRLIERYTRRGFDIRAGVFAGFYSLVLALAIPSLGVISGFGLAERRKEIGIIKALGWQTREVLELVALEHLLLSVASLPIIVAATVIWIHALNGIGLVGFFVPGMDILIPFPVPAKIFPIPFVLALILAPTLTMVGSIYWTWRAAVIPPSSAMNA
ncbi:MAG: FtsX-like permease family protein [Thermodesulfobacteriota bacterium]